MKNSDKNFLVRDMTVIWGPVFYQASGSNKNIDYAYIQGRVELGKLVKNLLDERLERVNDSPLDQIFPERGLAYPVNST